MKNNDFFDISLKQISAFEFHSILYNDADCALDYELSTLLYNLYCLSADPPMLNYGSYRHCNLLLHHHFRNVLENALSNDFGFKLAKFKDEFPTFDSLDWEAFRDIWMMKGQAWAEKLRAVMIKHRNIGHDWQFSDEQKELLKQYYDANQLLVDCLNLLSDESRDVRAEIEDTLLLPMSEIEKRKIKRRAKQST